MTAPGSPDPAGPAATLAVTVLGHDRPGIIADVTAVLAELGLNLEDSTMTLLRGHFAMTLVCSGGRSAAEVESALAPVTGAALDVAVREMPEEHDLATRAAASYLLTVHGADRPGIVSAVAGGVAPAGANTPAPTPGRPGARSLLGAEGALPQDAALGAVRPALAGPAGGLGVRATLRELESDDL